MAANAPSYAPNFAIPPGETLAEVLEQQGLSQSDLAERTGRPKKTINEIVNGKAAITPGTAIQLERVLGIPADLWNTLEQRYRAALARQAAEAALEAQTSWLNVLPVRALVRAGWVSAKSDKREQVAELLSYFGVASVEAWADVWSTARRAVAFRESATFTSDFATVAAWLRRGELEARSVRVPPFDAATFRGLLPELRTLSREPAEVLYRDLLARCAQAGVIVRFVPALPKLRVCGATWWITSSNPVMLLTLRYRSDDHLWFTVFHEAAHILLHGKRGMFVEVPPSTQHGDGVLAETPEDQTTQDRTATEREADRFARDQLIPPADYAAFRARRDYSQTAIQQFASELGIAPGIVVGRLQHDKVLVWQHRLNHLKRSFSLVPAEHASAGSATAC